ncbi:hypothetical protein GJ496_000184 [Pomphorhynchus laevis]|nr:hypothetical protein GJ496_000184 [Pomphorhynchus laevis]
MGNCLGRHSKPESSRPIPLRPVTDEELSFLRSTTNGTFACFFAGQHAIDDEIEKIIIDNCEQIGLLSFVSREESSKHLHRTPFVEPIIVAYQNGEMTDTFQFTGLPTSDKIGLHQFLTRCSLLVPPYPIRSVNTYVEIADHIVNDEVNFHLVICDADGTRKDQLSPFIKTHFIGKPVHTWFISDNCSTFRKDVDAFVQYRVLVMMEHKKNGNEEMQRYLEAFVIFIARQEELTKAKMLHQSHANDDVDDIVNWINKLPNPVPKLGDSVNTIQCQQDNYRLAKPVSDQHSVSKDQSNVVDRKFNKCEIGKNHILLSCTTNKDEMIGDCRIHNVVYASPSGLGHYQPDFYTH